ncbi:MAG: NUDIX hydrolase [Pseudomonadota bacterium]
MDKTGIRDAASVILLRDIDTSPQVLVGQRGKSAAFMPSKFVFPGGAVETSDGVPDLTGALDTICLRRLRDRADPELAPKLLGAALRELWEETGLRLSHPGTPLDLPHWSGFAEGGHVPSADGLSFVFRAITPPGRPRRFDARFFLVEASRITGDPDDFSRASNELGHLQWVPLTDIRKFDLPFITEVILAEIAALLRDGKRRPDGVPFFDNATTTSAFLRLE